jgi:hypothetical protein
MFVLSTFYGMCNSSIVVTVYKYKSRSFSLLRTFFMRFIPDFFFSSGNAHALSIRRSRWRDEANIIILNLHSGIILLHGAFPVIMQLNKLTCKLFSERDAGARFAPAGTFEYEWCQKWKQLDEMKRTQLEALEKQVKEAEDKLETDMVQAVADYEAEINRRGIVINLCICV